VHLRAVLNNGSIQYVALKTSTMPSMMLETLASGSAHRIGLLDRAGGLPEAA
jgi:hypothetical protein